MNADRSRIRTKPLLLLFAVPLTVMMALVWLCIAPVRGASIAGDTPDAPGSISGRVTNSDGEPLSGIEVKLYRQRYDTVVPDYPIGTVTTDEAGAYRFDLLGAGIYHVGYFDSSKSYAPAFYDNAASLGDAAEILVGGEHVADIDAVLSAGGAISGAVSLAVSADVMYSAAALLRIPDDNPGYLEYIDFDSLPGNFSFVALAPGRYLVQAAASLQDGYLFEYYDNASRVENATILEITTDEQYSGVDIVLGDGSDFGTIGGSVLDSNGRPLEDILLGWSENLPVQNFPSTGASTADGTFLATDVTPGTYYLAFLDPEGYYLTTPYTDETTGEPMQVTLEPYGMITGVQAVLDPASWITGTITVRDGIAAHLGLAFAHRLDEDYLYYPLFHRLAEVSPSGFYTLTGLPAGDYFVEAYAENFEDFFNGFYSIDGQFPATIPVGTNEVKTNINIELAPGLYDGAAFGQITAQGEAAAGMRIDLYSNSFFDYPRGLIPPLVPAPDGSEVGAADADRVDDRIFYALTDSEGAYRIEGLAPNWDYSGWFSDPNRRYASVCSVSSRFPYACDYVYMSGITKTVELDVNLVEAGMVQGRVILPSGDRAQDYLVQAYRIDQHINESGDYEWVQHSPAVRGAIGSDGRYELPGLYPGEYRIAVQYALAFSGWIEEGIVRVYPNETELYEGARLAVDAGVTRSDIDFLLEPSERRYFPFAGR